MTFLLPNDIDIFNSTQKLTKYVTLLPFTYIAIQWVPVDLHSSKLILYGMPHPLS